MIDMPTSDLSILHSGHSPICVAVVDKHFDGYMTLQFSAHSGVSISYDDDEFLLEGAWFWPAYPGPYIRFGRAPGVSSWDHRYVAFNGALAQRWVASGLFPIRPQRAPEDRDYARLFDEFLRLVQSTSPWRHAKAVNILEGILIDLAIDRSQAAMSEEWLETVIQRLSAGDGVFGPDCEALSRSCGMALSTLRRRFRDATGTPIHTFALQCRINRARELLGNTDTPIKLIAESLGYRDVYYFSQQFRHLVGASPGAYRRSRQE